MKSLAFVLGLLVAQLAFAEGGNGEANKQVADFVYTVKRGDTLGGLSKELFDTPARWKDVATYNHLSDANRIEPGQILNIQLPWMKQQPAMVKIESKAKVEALTGTVSVNGRAIKFGDEVAVGDKLLTAQGASVRMRLPDGSTINVMENSQLGIEKLEQKPGNFFASILRLISGQLEAHKAKYPEGQADLKIQTRSATLGVRGTHFRMQQQDNCSFAEIETGLVSFDADKTPQSLALAGGEGSVADGEHAAEVIPLLPAPTFPALPALLEMSELEWIMPEMVGATAYAGELAQDEEFSKGVASVHGEGRSILIKNLQDGQYWLRLRAVDSHGLQGMEGKTSLTVKLRTRKLATIKAYISGNSIELLWVGRKGNERYQVQIAQDQNFTQIMLDKQTQDNWVDLPRPKPGYYFMRVRTLLGAGRTEQWDVPMLFEVP